MAARRVAVLALWFSYMTVDDGAQLHERIGTTVSILQEDAGSSALDLFPSYTWQLVFLPLFGGLGLFMAAFLWRELQDRPARLAVIAAIGCLVVAVGLDFFEGLEEDHAWNLYAALPVVSISIRSPKRGFSRLPTTHSTTSRDRSRSFSRCSR
ncbi:MAG TPA: hypothetical protein QF650_04180 [Vicinamibacterales bacterium]|nr:hypothetical protein [Vicinamibacterales bacterium]